MGTVQALAEGDVFAPHTEERPYFHPSHTLPRLTTDNKQPSTITNLDPTYYDKLVRFCSYRERAISEVMEKMQKLEIEPLKHDDYLAELQEDGYQDERRYASAYASGRSRIKGWGRQKIKMHLMAKRVDKALIEEAISPLADDEYMERLRNLVAYKLERTKAKDDYERKSKVYRFLQQRGYETEHIKAVLFTD